MKPGEIKRVLPVHYPTQSVVHAATVLGVRPLGAPPICRYCCQTGDSRTWHKEPDSETGADRTSHQVMKDLTITLFAHLPSNTSFLASFKAPRIGNPALGAWWLSLGETTTDRAWWCIRQETHSRATRTP